MEKFAEIVSFIRKAFNQPEGFIALHEPRFTGNEKKYMEECIDSNFVSSIGKFVNLFEEDMARFTGAKKAVVCANGTTAVTKGFIIKNYPEVQPGSQIIVPQKPEKQAGDSGRWLALASVLASLAVSIATVVSLTN